jgi:hypothetical protein
MWKKKKKKNGVAIGIITISSSSMQHLRKKNERVKNHACKKTSFYMAKSFDPAPSRSVATMLTAFCRLESEYMYAFVSTAIQVNRLAQMGTCSYARVITLRRNHPGATPET